MDDLDAIKHAQMIADTAHIAPARGHIYVVQSVGQRPVKIGFTSRDDISVRIAGLQTGNPHLLRLLTTTRATFEDERIVHKTFAVERMCGEWFALSARVQRFIEVLSSCGVPLALEEALALDAPMPEEWMGLLVRETEIPALFNLEKVATMIDARKRGDGPPVYRMIPWGPRSFTRLMLLSEVVKWLRERKLFYRLDRRRLNELAIAVRDLDEAESAPA